MTTAHSDETKAAVLAEILTGASVRGVAKKYGVHPATIRGWRARAGLHSTRVPPQKKVEIGEQLTGHLQNNIATLDTLVTFFRDPAWLKKQSAAELAILFGVLHDKTARLLAAFRPGDAADGAIEADVTARDDGPGDGA